ncbi:hypothetical protein LTR78_001795 [Recurvomyces mirabilis]|uniref:tripeptidyl-peptidase II n=1 Tax=Recurvomyces mirabilis TaxID=574656 RepID=A0AAE1C558_9PEZI|nr:hypothetical protein LTR78_001795 [Recurvomyces mirabilis]KAK5156765.1 hypothetical protein LTS14_004978 [Recurvomyces mirabilis]
MLRLFVASLTLSVAIGLPVHDYVVHEERPATARQVLKRRAGLNPDAVLPIKIGLVQSGLDQAYDWVMDVSHPESSAYASYLTVAEVNDLFKPEPESIDAVREWLSQVADIDQKDILWSKNGWLAANIPVHAAEKAFRTSYFEHADREGRIRVGCDSYSLPSHIQSHVDYITPGVKSSPPLRKRSVSRNKPVWGPSWGPGGPGRRPPQWAPPNHGPWQMPPGAHGLPPDLQDCGRNITPTCIRALYDIPKAHLKDSVNALGLFEDGDFYAQSDLNAFFTQYAPNVPNGTHPIPAFIDGAKAPVAASDPTNTGESDIDMDMSYSLIYPQDVVLYQVDDSFYSADYNLTGFFNTFLDALDGSYCTYNYDGLAGDTPGVDPTYPDPNPGGYKGQLQCGVYAPTRVISVSYGEAEADVSARYQYRQCNEIMKLVLQGHTILLASGDYGVASFPGDDNPNGCLSGDGQNATIYNPDFVSSCPYILSVGATQLYSNQTVNDPESVMQDNLGPGAELFASHGGFSNRYKAPAYQKSALDTYFSKHDPGLPYYIAGPNGTNIGANGGVYNRAGRGIPDVSANGANFRAYTNGTDYHWYGTSLAAPLWASVLTLINEERTAVGKGPVGFVNPVLYENPWTLKDITNGSNPNCGSSGFAAVSGWDPATGLGTPNYPKLLQLFMSLP